MQNDSRSDDPAAVEAIVERLQPVADILKHALRSDSASLEEDQQINALIERLQGRPVPNSAD